jgi:hypothetical protein
MFRLISYLKRWFHAEPAYDFGAEDTWHPNRPRQPATETNYATDTIYPGDPLPEGLPLTRSRREARDSEV